MSPTDHAGDQADEPAGHFGRLAPAGLLAAELLVVVAGVAALVRRAAPSSQSPGTLRLALALAFTWGLSGGAGLAVAGEESHRHGGGHAHGQLGSPSVTEPGCPDAHDCSDRPH